MSQIHLALTDSVTSSRTVAVDTVTGDSAGSCIARVWSAMPGPVGVGIFGAVSSALVRRDICDSVVRWVL
jgi:hypothetical protein